MNMENLPLVPDPYTGLADLLDLTREESKRMLQALAYSAQLTVTTGQAKNILRCYRVAELWFKEWGAAKAAEWEWITQDQPFYLTTAFSVIEKFMPTVHGDTLDQCWDFLTVPERLKHAQETATIGTADGQLQDIERTLRPIAYVLKTNGHQL